MNTPRLSLLESHIETVSRIQEVIQEENTWLRVEKSPLPKEILEKKQALLPALDQVLAFLRDINAAKDGLTPGERSILKDARQKMMKIFYVDRENEQLLLKCSVTRQNPAPAAPANQSVNQVLLHHTYQNGEKPSESPRIPVQGLAQSSRTA